MKRPLILALVALTLAAYLCAGASAFPFSEELFAMEIPEGTHAYYYAGGSTNMTGTMLENAQKQDMICLVGVYGESGSLLYTFKAERREGIAENVAAELLSELSGTYVLGAPEVGEVAGRSCMVLSGYSQQNENYFVRIYVCGNAPCVAFTTMYQPEQSAQVDALLSTLVWQGDYAVPDGTSGDLWPTDDAATAPEEPATDDTFERDPTAVPLPDDGTEGTTTPDAATPDTSQPDTLEPLEPEGDAASSGKLSELIAFAKTNWLWLALGGAILLLGIVLIAVLCHRPKYQPRHGRY